MNREDVVVPFSSLKASLFLLITSSLVLGSVPPLPPPDKGVLGFQGSTVDIAYACPDPTVWKPYDLGEKPRPDLKSICFRHTGIMDNRGTNVQPILSAHVWKFPHDQMNLDAFAQYLLEQNPIKETSRTTQKDRVIVTGTAEYGGYTHVIHRAISFHNRIGMDVICDTTDSVYPQVKQAFESWIASIQPLPRISPTPVTLPNDIPAQTRALGDAATATPSTLEKHQPGKKATGDVAGIKDAEGMVILWNRSSPYFRTRVDGDTFAAFGDQDAWFRADGVPLQIMSTPMGAFHPEKDQGDPDCILRAHRDWEFRYMQEVLHTPCTLRSWSGKLPDGSPMLYWDVTPERSAGSEAIRHLFCTRYQDGAVIVVYSVETQEVSFDRAQNLVFSGISNMTFSRKKYDFTKIQKRLTRKSR